jgi:hypothetical protein
VLTPVETGFAPVVVVGLVVVVAPPDAVVVDVVDVVLAFAGLVVVVVVLGDVTGASALRSFWAEAMAAFMASMSFW